MNYDVWRTRGLSFGESIESVVGREGVKHFAAVREVGLDIENVWVSIVM